MCVCVCRCVSLREGGRVTSVLNLIMAQASLYSCIKHSYHYMFSLNEILLERNQQHIQNMQLILVFVCVFVCVFACARMCVETVHSYRNSLQINCTDSISFHLNFVTSRQKRNSLC